MPIIAPPQNLGKIQPSNTRQRGLDVQYSADSFGAGLGRALTSFGGALEVLQERKRATGRFDQLSSYTEFETDVKMSIENLKRDTSLDEAQFFERADALYEEKRSSYLNGIAPDYQQEFEQRTNQFKQAVVLDAFQFGNTQRDLFYRKKITEQLEKHKIDLDATPDRLEEVRANLHQQIVETDLPDIEQEAEIEKANRALEAISYKAKIKGAKATSLARPAGGIASTKVPPIGAAVLNAIAATESAGKYNVRFGGESGSKTFNSFADHPRKFERIHFGKHKGDVSSAAGRYQNIGSTWDIIRKETGITGFTPAEQDEGNWYWAQKTVMDQTGKSITELVNNKDFATLKKALGTQWEGPRMQKLEDFIADFNGGGQALADYSEVNNSDSFSNLTLEDRNSIMLDAEREATLNYNSLLKQQELEDNQRINEVMVGILDKTHGRVDIDNLRKEGILTDYADISRAYKLIDDQTENMRDFNLGVDRYDNGGVWDPQNSDHKKQANALFGDDGVDAVNKRDENYITDVAIPRFSKMSMLPSEMASLLYAGTQGSNVEQAQFSYDSLARLREANPVAFENQVDDKIIRELDAWDAQKDFATPQEALNRVQNRAVTVAERQEAEIFRAEALELVKEFPVVDEVLDAVNGGFLGFGSYGLTPESLIPGQRASLQKDYQEIFVEEYKRYRDVDKAKDATLKAVNKVWGVTELGGRAQFMRTPPEKAGYKPVKGSYEYISNQVRKRIGQPAPQWFELISDKQTAQEAAAWKAGVEGAMPPTYRVSYLGANGIPRVLGTEGTDEFSPIRINFEFGEKERAADEEEFIKLRSEAEAAAEKIRDSGKDLRFGAQLDKLQIDQIRGGGAIRELGGNFEAVKP